MLIWFRKKKKEELYFNCLVKPKLGVKRRVRILNKDNKGKGEAGLDRILHRRQKEAVTTDQVNLTSISSHKVKRWLQGAAPKPDLSCSERDARTSGALCIPV